MYKIFNTLSVFIRQFCLPNPYEIYFESIVYADVFNIIVGGAILHSFSFFLTSSVYEKGKLPSWIGSFLYCINYVSNTYLIQYLCNNFLYVELQNIIVIVFGINIFFYIIFRWMKNKFLHSKIFI